MVGKKGKSEYIFQAVIIFICCILALICLLPILNVVATSLSSPSMIMRGKVFFWPKEFTGEAYKTVLTSSSFLHSLIYTVGLTIVYTVLALFMTVLCAYPLSKSYLKGRKIIMVFIVFIMYFSAGTIPNYLVVKGMKILDSPAALILPGALSAYNMIIMRNFFMSIDKSILEAASIDGCSEFRMLVQIVLPLSTAVMATLGLFYAVSRWNAIGDVTYYITQPQYLTLQGVLRELIMNAASANLDIGQSQKLSKTVEDSVRSASIVLSIIPILMVYPFIQKYFTKGIMLGSVKG
jgi:putative aldouronate transport system permease protein